MGSTTWDRMKCPECSEFFGFEDMRMNADEAPFAGMSTKNPEFSVHVSIKVRVASPRTRG